MNNFEKLNKIDVSGHIEKKNNLSYLSWAWAYSTLLKEFPNAKYKVYENKDEWNYHTDGKTAWVKVSVSIDDDEKIEMLPVMDFKNKAVPLNALTSVDVNKAIQRALTKAIARHGLGLYIYAGEDLPEAEPIKNISQEQVLELVKLISEANTTMVAMFTGLKWNLTRLEDISENNYNYVKDLLIKKIESNKDK